MYSKLEKEYERYCRAINRTVRDGDEIDIDVPPYYEKK